MSAMPPGNPASNPFATSATYLMACQQLRAVAREVSLDPDLLERLMFPKRSQVVAVPVGVDGERGRSGRRAEELRGQSVQVADGVGAHQHGCLLSWSEVDGTLPTYDGWRKLSTPVASLAAAQRPWG